LHEGIDFRTKVTRSSFEQATADLVDRVTRPIHNALKDANMTLDQLESVILHGGSVRVPFVQKALEDVIGTDKVAKTVNADEAAVMGISPLLFKVNVGTIFRGAQLNNQFRVKDIRPKDYSNFPITIASNVTLDNSKGILYQCCVDSQDRRKYYSLAIQNLETVKL
jgi:hypoxia up-regulated 1